MTTARQRRLQLIQPTDVTKGFAAAVADAWRQHRLEVITIALLAIAGLIFPAPIWLVGFLLWIGYGAAAGLPALVIPNIVATLVGTAVIAVAFRLRR